MTPLEVLPITQQISGHYMSTYAFRRTREALYVPSEGRRKAVSS